MKIMSDLKGRTESVLICLGFGCIIASLIATSLSLCQVMRETTLADYSAPVEVQFNEEQEVRNIT